MGEKMKKPELDKIYITVSCTNPEHFHQYRIPFLEDPDKGAALLSFLPKGYRYICSALIQGKTGAYHLRHTFEWDA
jgi:hypothetical protein